MKKTLTVNLGGTVFNIDDDAYRLLDNYLSNLKIHFRKEAQTLSRVVIPQAVSTSIPGVVANVIFLIKESSVVSAIALADVMYMAKDLIGMYYSTYESLFMLVVAYLIILLPISLFGTWLERRFDYERR